MRKITVVFVFFILALPISAQEVGIQLYSLRNQFKTDVGKSLDQIQSWGLTKLEGGETYGMSLIDFQKELALRNMSVVSVGATFEDLEKDPMIAVKNAQNFGAKYVMCAWVPHNGNKWGLDETQHATQVFNKAGEILKKNGITLAYHAHGYEFRPYKKGTFFDYMVQNATHFTFELDVFWAHHGGGDPLALMKKYKNKFTLLHLKDMDHGVKGNNTGHENVETNVVLGKGQIDIAGVIAEAKNLGIEYMFIEDESSKVIEQIPQSLKFIETQNKK